MTMVTASTSLTIFIMNIHFCGAEAKPVPQWAKVLIIDYMSKIFFVYEVGENCASSSTSSAAKFPQDENLRKQVSDPVQANGKLSSQQDWQSHKHPRPQTPRPQHKPRVKHHITREESIHTSAYTVGKYHDSNEEILNGDCCKIGHKVLFYPEEKKCPCCLDEKKSPHRAQTVSFGPCVLCSYGSGIPGVNTKLVRNVEYIANCFREQRATCAKGAEWKKVAKVMDRFFMWIFFIMVFLMSILIIGKAA